MLKNSELGDGLQDSAVTHQSSTQDPQIMYFLSQRDDEKQDFRGRVTRPSKKNFQLTDDFDEKRVYLQFGRNGKEAFNLDVSYPFSIYQAFAICLSAFDYKLSWNV